MHSHLENCQRVCAVCWNKCSRSARPVEITLIKEFVIENYTSKFFSFLPGYAHRVVGIYMNIVVGIFEEH